MLATASVVAGDASAHTTTSTGNTIATEHLHLMMRVLGGGNMSAHSKFAPEYNVVCGWYRSYLCSYRVHKPTYVTKLILVLKGIIRYLDYLFKIVIFVCFETN